MRREGLLDLNEAVQNPGRTLTFDVKTELSQEEDIDLLSPIQGQLEAVSTGSTLLVQGDFTAKVVVECARCAAPLEKTIEFSMNDEFDVDGVPSAYNSEGGYAQVIDEEPFKLFEKNALIKDTYLRQGLLVSLPYQPLCTNSWDEPCPNAPKTESEPEKEAGHPAMMALEKFRKEED